MLTPKEIQELSLALAELKAEAAEAASNARVAYWLPQGVTVSGQYFKDRLAALSLAAARIEEVLKAASEAEAAHNAAIPAKLAEINARESEAADD